MAWYDSIFEAPGQLISGVGDFFSGETGRAALPAAILGTTQLISGLSSTNDDIARLQLEEQRRQFDLNRELAERKLALDAAQGSGSTGAALAAAQLAAETQRKIANQQIEFAKRKEILGARQQMLSELLKAAEGRPDLLLAARQGQVQAAQNTGQTGLQAFNNLASSLQRPILRA